LLPGIDENKMICCVIFKQYQFEKNNLSFLEVLHVFTVQNEYFQDSITQK